MARDRASRPESRPLRLFVAVDVPEEVRAGLAAATAGFHDAVQGARWSPQENWHVTLKFLGSVWPRLLDWVPRQVQETAAEARPFSTRITSLGAFPSARRARVLWAGLDDADGRFRALAASLDRRLQAEFAPEKRPFTPHLTVARFRTEGPVAGEVVAADVSSEPFEVDALTLYRSRLQRPAARYEALGRIAFAG